MRILESLVVLTVCGFAVGSILSQWLIEKTAPPRKATPSQRDEPEEVNPYDHLFDEERV